MADGARTAALDDSAAAPTAASAPTEADTSATRSAGSASAGRLVATDASIVKTESGRHAFLYKGRKVYEWEQSLEDLDLYIDPPPGLRASQVHCEIRARHLVLGIKGNKPFLDEDFVSPVFVEESVWVIEDGVLHLNLRKVHRGETWKGVFKGHVELDPLAAAEVQKKLMLERFQLEHPGFDFSGAEFSGAAPDPRSFMGGMRTT